MKKYTYVLRAWHPDTGDIQRAISNDLADLDAMAIRLNDSEQADNPGSELHFHAERADTPLMLPAVDQVAAAAVRIKK